MENRAWQRIRRYLEADQQIAARIALESLVQRAPADVEARVLLAGAILSGDKRVREAADQLRAAAVALPQDDADLVAMVALAMLRVGEVVGARKCLENPAVEKTASYENLMSLAHVHQLMGEHKKSLAFMDRAKAQGYDNADFRYFRGVQLQFNGRLDEAETEMERCLQMGPTFGRASLTLARLKRQTPQSNHLPYLREQLRRVESGTEDHASFEFALYKELEDLGDYENAWAALQRGNAIMHDRLRHDPDEERSLFESLISGTDELPPRADSGSTGPQPIFIVGLPRSGTTLLERILGNHSMVQSAGELSDFPRQIQWEANHFSHPILDRELVARAQDLDYAAIGRRYLEQSQWRANGKPFYTDKLPPNFMLAGFIKCAFPNAPILHMVRTPMDVCFSNYRAMFGDSYPYSYDMQSLISHYRCYRRLMEHWHRIMPGEILDVSYNDLVRDPESMVRKILDFCRLPYEPNCVDLTRNSTPVATMSSAQTRKEIHDRSIGHWERYREQLASLEAGVSATTR